MAGEFKPLIDWPDDSGAIGEAVEKSQLYKRSSGEVLLFLWYYGNEMQFSYSGGTVVLGRTQFFEGVKNGTLERVK